MESGQHAEGDEEDVGQEESREQCSEVGYQIQGDHYSGEIHERRALLEHGDTLTNPS